MSDTTKNGELGDGKEHTEDTIKEFVEDSYGGEDVVLFTEEVITTIDTTTGPEPGDISMSPIENWNKENILVYILMLYNIKF